MAVTSVAGQSDHWQIRRARQRFGELVEAAQSHGPQFVTKHGEVAAVVLCVEEYRRLKEGLPDFKEFLLYSMPKGDDIEFERSKELPRIIDLGE